MLRRALLALSLLAAPVLAAPVLAAQEPASRHLSVVGSVRDSITDRPLADAMVQLVRTDQLTKA